MRRRDILKSVSIAGLGTALAGCVSSFSGEGGGSDPVTIGVLGPKTGPLSKLWGFYESNIKLAIDQINNDGNLVHDGDGIDIGGSNRKVKFVAYDTESKPNVGASAAERAIDQDDVSIVLGAMSSTTTLAIMDVLDRKQVPGITSVSVNQKITGSEGNKWMFRNKDTDTMRAKWISKAIADEIGYSNVAMIGPNNDFGIGRMDAFAKSLGENGVNTLTKQSFNPEQQSFLSELEKIKAKDPDALYMVLNDPTHGEQMIPQARQVGFEGLIGTGPLGTPDMPEKVGDGLDGTYIEITFPNEAKSGPDHVSRWADNLDSFTNGEIPPNYIGAPTFDAVNAIVDSYVRAGEDAPEPVYKAMTNSEVKGVYPYPNFTLKFNENNQAEVVSGLGQWQKKNGEWSLEVMTGPFAQ